MKNKALKTAEVRNALVVLESPADTLTTLHADYLRLQAEVTRTRGMYHRALAARNARVDAARAAFERKLPRFDDEDTFAEALAALIPLTDES